MLERYLEGEYDESLWCHTLQKLVKQRKLFPCFQGSALQDEGIDSFLTGLVRSPVLKRMMEILQRRYGRLDTTQERKELPF